MLLLAGLKSTNRSSVTQLLPQRQGGFPFPTIAIGPYCGALHLGIPYRNAIAQSERRPLTRHSRGASHLLRHPTAGEDGCPC